MAGVELGVVASIDARLGTQLRRARGDRAIEARGRCRPRHRGAEAAPPRGCDDHGHDRRSCRHRRSLQPRRPSATSTSRLRNGRSRRGSCPRTGTGTVGRLELARRPAPRDDRSTNGPQADEVVAAVRCRCFASAAAGARRTGGLDRQHQELPRRGHRTTRRASARCRQGGTRRNLRDPATALARHAPPRPTARTRGRAARGHRHRRRDATRRLVAPAPADVGTSKRASSGRYSPQPVARDASSS